MQTQDISQLPVFEGHTPVGAIYEDQILNLALQGKDLRKMAIREVMSEGRCRKSRAKRRSKPPDVPAEPRRARRLCPDGQRPLRNHHQVRLDGYHRGIDGAKSGRSGSKRTSLIAVGDAV